MSKLDPVSDTCGCWNGIPIRLRKSSSACASVATGSYALVKAYVRTVRPDGNRPFSLRLCPGECAQVDWGAFCAVPVGHTHRQLSFFVMVLCYSRMLYVEFTVSQTMEHFLACHQHAFDFFGGIPHKVMVDNLNSAVLKRAVGEAPVLNPKYLDFATHHGFTIAPCNVGKGNEKGRVENGVGYVKKNFLAGLEPRLQRPQSRARYWLDTVANACTARPASNRPCYGRPSGPRCGPCHCIRSLLPPCPRCGPLANFV